MRLSNGVSVRTWVAGGLAGGATAALAFAVLHAIAILPIWNSLLSAGSIIRGGGGGVVAGWAAYELHQGITSSPVSGLRVGGFLWLLLLPATAFGVAASALGVRSELGGWEVVIEALLTIVVAGLVAWRVTRRRKAAAVVSLAAIVLVMMLGGPFPLRVSRPAWALLFGLLPIFLLAGAVMGGVVAFLSARSNRAPES